MGMAAVAVWCVGSAWAEDWLFNFGPAGTEPIAGWIQVEGRLYDEAHGWGWESKPDISRRRGKAMNPVEDTLVGVSARGREAVFRIDLEPGLYEIASCRGDAAHPANTTAFLNQERTPWSERGVLPAGEFAKTARTVWVRDGVLRLRIPPRPNAGEPYNMVNWLRVQPVDAASVACLPDRVKGIVHVPVPGFSQAELLRKITPLPVPVDQIRPVAIPAEGSLVFNFGLADAAVPADVLQTEGHALDAKRGWGWTVPANALRRRGKAENPLEDTSAGVSPEVMYAEFVVVLPPGIYELEVCMNDAAFPYHAQLLLAGEAEFWINEKVQPAGKPLVRSRRIKLDDGILRLRMPGNSPFNMLSYVKISCAGE